MFDILNFGNECVEESTRFLNSLVHLPISSDYRTSHFPPLSVNASTPGSFCPDKNSREAPPPVDMWLIFDSTPACTTAAAESPPPTMENAGESATARAMANVPCENLGFSKTPIGPFHTIVLAAPIK